MALELQETLNATKNQIESIRSSQSTIKTSLEYLANDKTQEYSRVLAQVQEEQRLMMEMMKQCQEDYRRLVDEERANIEVLREAQRESELERLSQADTLSVSYGSEVDEVDASKAIRRRTIRASRMQNGSGQAEAEDAY
ncbi:hypothetical protein F4781DRAFT_142615 [Annulohypoxylon bovei var. microspora]|nr:hypothetical protein F4781DRAFT_142615 [Annulohypoxylon bovei var. microspora]